MSRLTDAATTATGVVLGAAVVGLPIGWYLAHRWLNTPITATAKPYSQAEAITNAQRNLRKAD